MSKNLYEECQSRSITTLKGLGDFLSGRKLKTIQCSAGRSASSHNYKQKIKCLNGLSWSTGTISATQIIGAGNSATFCTSAEGTTSIYIYELALDEESKKDTQNYNNYDSHSEQKPHQTETVNSDNQQDRSSGMNSDSNSKNGNQNLENYPSEGNDDHDEIDEDDDFEDDEMEEDDDMDEDKQNRSYDSESERRKRSPEFPKSENSSFPSLD